MADIKHSLENILSFFKLIRYWQWADKLQSMAVAIMCLMIFGHQDNGLFDDVVVFFLYLILGLVAAFLINSYADRSADLRVGKDFVGHFSMHLVRRIFMFCTAGFAVLPVYFNSPMILVLNAGLILLGIAYSVPPLRLKERGVWGLMTATVAQRLPFLFFRFIVPDESALVWYLFGWLLIVGFLIEMGHQIEDFDNDSKLKIKTFAQIFGLRKSNACVYFATVFGVFYLVLIFVGAAGPVGGFASQIFLWAILIIFSQHAVLYAFENAWAGFPLTNAKQFWKKDFRI